MTNQADRQTVTSLPLLILIQAVVSAASLVVEIVAGRMLAPYLGMSLYTWTSVIAVVLAGFSAGHWAGGRIASRNAALALSLTGWNIMAAAITTAAAVLILRSTAGPVIEIFDNPVPAIVAITSLAFFLPSFFAGVPAPVLAQVAVADAHRQQRDSGPALGAMFAAGALGAIFGTLAAGFIFIAWLGSVRTMLLVAALYFAVALLLLALARQRSGQGGSTMTAIALLLPATAAIGMLALETLARPDPCTRESQYFCIRVVDGEPETGAPSRIMVLDHLVHGISMRDDPAEMVTVHGFLLDGLARKRMGERRFTSFFIGGGSYSIPRSWTQPAILSDVTVAEIDPAVTQIAVSDYWLDQARVRILETDARVALAASDQLYSVIIGDAFTDIAVPPHLITKEFFELVSSRLEEDGIYLMNVIDHLDRLQALAAITKTLGTVFPAVEIWAPLERPEPGARAVFILLAANEFSQFSKLDNGVMAGGRLSQEAVARLLERVSVPVLTDDYAPIDRLMGPFD